MPRARDLLTRFRPSGTPGAAGLTGVPVDRAVGPGEELAAVFAALAGTERECEELRARARADAVVTRQRAEDEAGRLLADARAQEATERAAAVAELRRRHAAGIAASAAEAEGRAARVREHAEQRMSGCVDDVVAAVRELAAGP